MPRRIALPRKTPAGEFAIALRDCYLCGYCTEPVELEYGTWAATPTIGGFAGLAYELATRLGGQLWPGNSSISYVCGSHRPAALLVSPDNISSIRASQDLLANIGVRPNFGWSVGRLARAALAYVIEPSRVPASSLAVLDEVEFGCRVCVPGTYLNAVMYDVSAYYYTMLTRAESLRARVTADGRVSWPSMSDHETGRFKELLELIQDDKLLRNSLVGVAIGGRKKRLVYAKGPGPSHYKNGTPVKRFDPTAEAHRSVRNLPGGALVGLGAIIVRSGFELTAIESKRVDSVYTHTDSVTSVDGSFPELWKSLGFGVKIVGSGESDICRLGVRKVGHAETELYKRGQRTVKYKAPWPIPERLLYPQWL